MKNIRSAANRAQLRRFMHGRTILVFDFDGTLAPIVRRPEVAKMSPSMRKAFIALAKVRPCAVVTGRSLASIRPKFRGAPVVEMVGNHGMEWEPPIHKFTRARAQVKAWGKILEAQLGEMEGIQIENKQFTLSVHYRSAPDHEAARLEVLKVIKGLGKIRVMGGKEVFNLVPVGMPDKGTAVLALMKRFKATHAIFFGDDVTDEDVFRRKHRAILSVHIGRGRKTAAPYYLDSLAEMEKFLEEMRKIALEIDSKELPPKFKRLTKARNRT